MDVEQTLTNDEAVRELLALLKQNAMKEQANGVFELCSYVDSLEHKLEQMTEQMSDMQQQIKEMKEDTLVNHARAVLNDTQENLNKTYHQAKDKIFEVKESVKSIARSIVAEAKIMGREALFRVTEFAHIKPALVSIRESVNNAITSTDKNIEKFEILGKAMREAGQTVANAFRTFADKPEVDYSKAEKSHVFTNAIVKPMQITKNILESMSLRLDGSIDKLDNLAMNVQQDREEKAKEEDTVIDMAKADLFSMVAEEKEYQYNADAFEARKIEKPGVEEGINEAVRKQEARIR